MTLIEYLDMAKYIKAEIDSPRCYSVIVADVGDDATEAEIVDAVQDWAYGTECKPTWRHIGKPCNVTVADWTKGGK